MNQEIEKLISIAVKGEQITDRQREIIRNKAMSLKEDPDEAELLLDLSIKRKQAIKDARARTKDVRTSNNTVAEDSFDDSICRIDEKEANHINGKHSQKNRITAALLATFLGTFGAHKFYIGEFGKGIVYILFSWTFIPTIIGFGAGVKYLFQSDKSFRDSISK